MLGLKPIPLTKPSSPLEPQNKNSDASPLHSPSPLTIKSRSQSPTSTHLSLKIPFKYDERKTPSPPRITYNFNDMDPVHKTKKGAKEPPEAKKGAKDSESSNNNNKGKSRRGEKSKASRKPSARQSTSGGDHHHPANRGLKRERDESGDKGPQKKKKAADPAEVTLENKDLIRGLACKTTDKYGRCLYNYLIPIMNTMYWDPAGKLPNDLINAFENSIYYDGKLSKCPNPKCNNKMQKNSQSKYCSEKCALEVARQRIRMRLEDYKAGDNGYRIPTFTPENPPLPTRYPVIVRYKKDGTPIPDKSGPPVVKTSKENINDRIGALLRERGIATEYKRGLDEKIAFVETHFEKVKKYTQTPSVKEEDAESTKSAKVFKDCPICGKAYLIQSIVTHFPTCRRKKERADEWQSIAHERVDTRIFCGAEVKVPKKHQLYPWNYAPIYCRVPKYSCIFHNPDVVEISRKKLENTSFALPVCGFPLADGSFCALSPSDCEAHANWYPYTLFTLKQQLCSVSAAIEDMDEKIEWLRSCTIQQDNKIKKLEEMKH